MRQFSIVAGATVLALICGSAARANVIDTTGPTGKVNKPAAKLRADIGKQVSKYTVCLVKATTKCELKGLVSGVECELATGNVAYEMTPGKNTQKFHDAIAKCDSKLALTKKGTDYVGIGCPGDCNAAAPGVQECADIPTFQATIEATTGSTAPKVQLGTLAAGIDLACSFDVPGMPPPTDQGRKDCVKNNAAALSKISRGLFKCQAKCENDYKGTKGGGGLTNGTECDYGPGDDGPDGPFHSCVDAVIAKAGTLTSLVQGMIRPLVIGAVNRANDGLYNRFDPAGTPPESPCGNCGNNDREGAEECDGTDNGVCATGPCKTDCTCP